MEIPHTIFAIRRYRFYVKIYCLIFFLQRIIINIAFIKKYILSICFFLFKNFYSVLYPSI